MQPITGHFVMKPDDLEWKVSNQMKIPFADLLDRTKSQILGARIWRMPPWSANTYHKHVRAEEMYFVLEGIGRIRVGDQAITVPKYGTVLVGPDQLRQIFNDSDQEVVWLIVGAPDNEFGPCEAFDIKLFYPVDPKQLPKEMGNAVWPPIVT